MKKGTKKIKRPKTKDLIQRLFTNQCPIGQHWVKTHSMKIPPSNKNPLGGVTTRLAHCSRNPASRGYLTPSVINELSKLLTGKSKKLPCPLSLEFKDGSQYDESIANWVHHWNSTFNPNEPLDPDFVKALIASESSFNHNKLADPKNQKSARGLMQITDESRKILGDEKGELKNNYLSLTREDLNDPNINICAGIRWLFHKRHLASHKLGRQATWEESVAEYKGLSKGLKSGDKRAMELMNRFKNYQNQLKSCKK